MVTATAAAANRGHRVERVVDEIADDGDEVTRVGMALRQPRVLGHGELDPALRRDSGLAEQERGQRRLAHLLDDRADERLVYARRLVDEPDRVVVTAELDQAGDYVQTVCELVLLRPERVGQ